GRFEGKRAIKFVGGYIAPSKLEDRFQREAMLLARLAHPNIARLYDAGTTEQGRHYLVLEYVDGERIDRYCEEHNLTTRERVRLFVDVVAAIAHAHAGLVVHRDLKPSNVLVTAFGVVKLLDFGIARLVSNDNDVACTKFEDAALTPDFAAPEQLLHQPPSTATDVYQLGVLLFSLLTGRLPLDDQAVSAERIEGILRGNLPRASDRAASERRPFLRGDLDAIIAKALRRNPEERYATAAALNDDLLRYLNDEPVAARRGATLYRARKFIARHRISVVAAFVVGITLVSAMVVTRSQLLDARRQREAALSHERRAETTKDFLQLVLSEFQSRGEVLTTKTLLERSSALLKAQYADQPVFVSEMLIELATEYGSMMELNTALNLLTDARDIAQSVGNDSLLAHAECLISSMRAGRNGSTDEAQIHLTRGLNALARVSSSNVEIRAHCMISQAALHLALSDRIHAITGLQEARALLEGSGMTRGAIYSDTLSSLATVLMEDGRVVQALSIFRLSADSHVRNGRGGTRAKLTVEQNIAVALYRLGEIRESYEIQSRARDRLLKLNSTDDMDVTIIVNTASLESR
ncbi:MAG TPA: serine/threonine-protein kinase, partial [Steroidobacteraceae bacterium]|nr:serine/threonine-protein kinase [Steroidobacteraceae bacterium]